MILPFEHAVSGDIVFGDERGGVARLNKHRDSVILDLFHSISDP